MTLRDTGLLMMTDQLDAYDYFLPKELVAQSPAEKRDDSRLMVLPATGNEIVHKRFRDLPEYLRAGDLLVLNNSKVLPARLFGKRATGGKVEVLLLRETVPAVWEALINSRAHLSIGETILFEKDGQEFGSLRLIDSEEDKRIVRFDDPKDAQRIMDGIGIMPLPPYIKRDAEKSIPIRDDERYQTVYAAKPGAVAAPTAGLHFTSELLSRLESNGVKIGYITLHVGEGTFRPIRSESIAEHQMSREWFEISGATASMLAETRASKNRVIGVGTTVTRVLETLVRYPEDKKLSPADTAFWEHTGWASLFIHPPHGIQAIDGLLTNFHLPRSTPLLLASAFGGRERILAAYEEAKAKQYRFYSYGDAMLII